MLRTTRIALLSALVFSVLGCAADHSVCGSGDQTVVGDDTYCGYALAIVIEGGFECPREAPNLILLRDGGICAPDGHTTVASVPAEVCRDLDQICIGPDPMTPMTMGPGPMQPMGPFVSTCPGGVAPLLDDCDQTSLTADCGGTGGPVLACSDGRSHLLMQSGRDCVWFQHACLPAGWEPTECDFFFAYAYGDDPWTPDRERNVDVVIDAAAGGTRTATCMPDQGAFDGFTPCDDGYGFGAAEFRGETAVLRAQHGFDGDPSDTYAGYDIVIDITANGARVCRAKLTDAGEVECRDYVRGDREDCAVEGTLRLRAIPQPGDDLDAIAFELDARFADGGTVHMTH